MNDKITSFWNWFKENHQDYKNFSSEYHKNPQEGEAKLDRLIGKLKEFSAGLFVEIGGKDSSNELIITPQGIKQHFGDAIEMVQHAPEIEGWQFFATKPAHDSDFNFRMGDIEISPDSITFMPLHDEKNPDQVAIRLFHKDYKGEDENLLNAIGMGIYQGLDTLLGEIATTFDINYLDFADVPNEGETALPLKDLPGYISWKKKERANYDILFPEEQTSLLQGEENEKPLMMVVNTSLQFYGFKEKFPYLVDIYYPFQEVDDMGFPVEDMDRIYAMEDNMITALCSEEQGHFIATESHDGLRRILFHTKDKEKAEIVLQKLRQNTSDYQLNYMIIFDPFWVASERYL